MSALHPHALTTLRAATLAVCTAFLGLAATAQDVSISAPGVADDVQDRLRNTSLLLRPAEDGDAPRTGQDIVAATRADYGRLIGVLYEQGFFAPVITIRLDGRDATTISPFQAPAQISRVEIVVEPGPPFRLGQADIGPLADGTTLPPEFQSGETATTPLLRATTRAALDGWRVRGHATADVDTQQITANNRAAILDVAIRVDPGPVITFGNLLPEGQDRMRVSRILEIAGLPTGDVYSPAALARAEERLRDTGAFSAVDLQLRHARAGDIADVTAIVDEAPLRRLGFGAEISTNDGVGLSAYWIHRNLLGGAERLRFDASISGLGRGADIAEGEGVDIELKARLDRPATFTPDTSLYVEGIIVRLDEPLFAIDSVGIEVGLTHQFNEHVTVEGGVGLSFSQFEDALGERDVTLFYLPFGLIYENRDDPTDARAGAYAEASLTPFVPVGGNGGARFTFDGRAYYGIGPDDRTRFAARVQLGSIFGGDILDIPSDYLFFSGGSGTVRGQDYLGLGAIQAGQPSGGRGFLGLSGEIRHDIGDTDFGIVGFADVGWISEGPFGDGSSDWHAGAGLGLRYNTPFGPIRVDLATPASGDRAGQELFLYIGIGQAF